MSKEDQIIPRIYQYRHSIPIHKQARKLSGKVSIGHILHAAAELEKSPVEIVSRLRELGLSLPEQLPDWDIIGPFTEEDRNLINVKISDHQVYWLEQDAPLAYILTTAILLKRSPVEIVFRLRELGFSLPEQLPDWDIIGPLTNEDQIILGIKPEIQTELLFDKVSISHILRTAAELEKSPVEIVSRLRELGLSLPEQLPDWDIIGPLTNEDRNLIPWEFEDSENPQEYKVSISHILSTAVELEKSPVEIVFRLRELGFSLPEQLPNWNAIGRLRKEDQILINQRTFRGRVISFDRVEEILEAAFEINKSPLEIISRLIQFGFEIKVDVSFKELEAIVQIWDGCTKEQARQRLSDTGWVIIQ
jgi:hypothetical protein